MVHKFEKVAFDRFMNDFVRLPMEPTPAEPDSASERSSTIPGRTAKEEAAWRGAFRSLEIKNDMHEEDLQTKVVSTFFFMKVEMLAVTVDLRVWSVLGAGCIA